MTPTDARVVAWRTQLLVAGRVTADVRRGRAFTYLLVALFLTLVGASMVTVGSVATLVVGVPCAGLFAWAVAVNGQQLLRVGSWRSPQVLVDVDGLTVRHGGLSVPWDDVVGAYAYRLQHNRWVGVVVTDEWYDAWAAGRPWPLRMVVVSRLLGQHRGTLTLPPNLDVDHEAFATWLTDEAEERMRVRFERGQP